ncbi:TlpA family protein disulfide reductase [Aquimarina litoralis]|uniref:TlpA family protein disulfide reductase n=1 Tax=Aquimarina litoralis TaxID=584605 RepID=UPI001C5717B3|nr:TlpA disulfide reductase family protein [Aquimarina litoralis]MBW1297775.1 redoxin family protein [Aquimarina litoralis]
MTRLRIIYHKEKSNNPDKSIIDSNNNYPRINIKVICYLLIVSILLTFNSCTQKTSNAFTTLKGKLPTDIKEARIDYGEGWENLAVTREGTFADTLIITTPQYVYLSFGEFTTRIYFTNGDEVVISAESDISFSGSNAEINNYLYKDYQDDQAIAALEFNSHKKIFSQKEVPYISYRDSIKNAKIDRLKTLSADTKPFQDFHQKNIEFQYQYDVARYPNYHSYYFQEYKPTELIMNFLKGVDFDNETYAKNYSGYRFLVDLVLDKQIENLVDKSLSSIEASLIVLQDIKSPTILHGRLNNALYNFTVNEKNMEEIRDKMLALAKQERTKQAITNHYNVISKLKPGNPAPSFEFENYKGGRTKLSDFKGKYVYIDVWATWCAPCIKEIPYLKKIEEEFSDANIEFVSVSVDAPRFYNTWRKMIESKELIGTQLITDNGWDSDFVRDYGMQGIPRFILLDDKGDIVSADAKKPSDPKLKEQLEALGL